MARMIPPVRAAETPDSERRVYERFQSELPDTWTVVHGQRFLLPANRPERSASHPGLQEGEIDFLILDPSRGAICLEVKGGGVQRTADGWSSVDRRGTTHQIKDPGKQASRGVHAIRRYRLVLRENVDPGAIAVVSTRTLKNSPFARDHRAGRFELVNLGNRGRKSDPVSPARRVVFDTLHRFKGLERDVVILLDLPGGDHDAAGRGAASSAAGTRGDLPARQRYVAASRAKHLLVVVRLRPESPA